MVSLQQGLRADGIHVSMAQLCRWFEQPRRMVYYRPTKSPPKVKPELAAQTRKPSWPRQKSAIKTS